MIRTAPPRTIPAYDSLSCCAYQKAMSPDQSQSIHGSGGALFSLLAFGAVAICNWPTKGKIGMEQFLVLAPFSNDDAERWDVGVLSPLECNNNRGYLGALSFGISRISVGSGIKAGKEAAFCVYIEILSSIFNQRHRCRLQSGCNTFSFIYTAT